MSEPSEKETLRQEAIKHRARISPFDDKESAEQAVSLFFASVKPRKKQIIALYWPKGDEFSTAGLYLDLKEEGFQLALPKVLKEENRLTFHLFKDERELQQGAFSIMEPPHGDEIDPDILIVPLLAFDRRGVRIGYGGGFYDRAIAALRVKKNIQAVGWCYAQQAVIFNLPCEDHDQKLDWVITPQNAHYFGD